MSGFTSADAAALFRREPERQIEVDVGSVAHRQVGSGPDVLFVHGWPVSGATFRTLLPHLVDHVTCHLIDLPGVGSSRFSRVPRSSTCAGLRCGFRLDRRPTTDPACAFRPRRRLRRLVADRRGIRGVLPHSAARTPGDAPGCRVTPPEFRLSLRR